ncbi:Hypothetical predicted protein [Paramuricea clavata]|uniref:Uncharacterized protein n=1 Tax=Paramuricea clavata TaxID=317549 RepID=A0A6S7J5X1_PARCT|nr:Hypothetical predicted protein [Paramuricea clavata]
MESGKNIDMHDIGQEQDGKARGLTAVGAMPRVLLSIWMNFMLRIMQVADQLYTKHDSELHPKQSLIVSTTVLKSPHNTVGVSGSSNCYNDSKKADTDGSILLPPPSSSLFSEALMQGVPMTPEAIGVESSTAGVEGIG